MTGVFTTRETDDVWPVKFRHGPDGSVHYTILRGDDSDSDGQMFLNNPLDNTQWSVFMYWALNRVVDDPEGIDMDEIEAEFLRTINQPQETDETELPSS